MLKVVAGLLSVDIAILVPTGLVNINFSLVCNPWFSKLICLIGIFLVTFFPAKSKVTVCSVPSKVPTPTVW